MRSADAQHARRLGWSRASPRTLVRVLASLLHLAPVVHLTAQETTVDTLPAIALSTTLDTTGYLSPRAEVVFSLNRPLTPSDGEIVVLIGGVDVSALLDRGSQRLVYRPGVAALPAGTTDIVVYQKRGAAWIELRRLAVRVLNAAGFSRASFSPSATLGSKGQFAEGRSSGIPEPKRATFQDFVFNGSLGTTIETPGYTIETSSTFLGVSRRQEALRYGQRQEQAPRVDLADYHATLRAGRTQLTLGHTTFGASRHLVSGFGSRGATLAWNRGGTQLTLGALGATPTVGWDHLLGATRANHRVLGASLGRELVTGRRGALRLEATLLDASRLPLSGFRQGAVVDAERSAGGALQLTASTHGQRVLVSGGYARSRFENPGLDAQLTGDTIVRAVERETRGARFLDATVAPIRNLQVRGLGAVNLGMGWRHERIDPLYRSVTAPVQADRDQHAADATLTLGPLSGQVGVTHSRDNLARIPTILTTIGDVRTANFAMAVAQLLRLRRRQTWFPTLTLALNRTHPRADGTPAGGVFRPQDVPDQVSTLRDAGAQWQLARWRVVARRNRSHQDNRQPQRTLADFASGSDALSFGTALGSSTDIALDLGKDFQQSLERGERTDTRRLTFNANLRRGQSTSMVMSVSLLRTRPPTGPATVNGEQRIEVTHPLAFPKGGAGSSRGQLFVRFGRTTSILPDFARLATDPAARMARRQWAIASGLTLRVH